MTIGITGCDPGLGVTHLAIALCSYCASKQKKRVAYLELHARNEIARLLPEEELLPAMKSYPAEPAFDAIKRKHQYFTLRGVDYYPHVTGSSLPSLLNLGYDYLILDTGSLAEADLSELLRCDHKLVLGSLAPWKIWHFDGFFQRFGNTVNLGEGFYFLLQMTTTENPLHFCKTHHISTQTIPFIQNPLRIKKDHFSFLNELLACRGSGGYITKL